MRRATIAAALLATPTMWLFGPTEAPPAQPPARLAQWRADPLGLPDPGTAAPAQVASRFAALSEDQAEALAGRYPQIVGNLDGVPEKLRYAANLDPRFAGRQLLALDARGDGRVAEVVGDLGGAERVTVLVPGVDADLENFDSGHGGVRRRAPSWWARQLYAEMRAQDPAAKVAVIAWLGYDPPEGIGRDAFREDRAAAGAIAITRLVDALVLDRPQRGITVIGHSYGSIVAGLAAPRLSPQVTDIVAIGSPGMGVADRAALRTGARVWAGSAPDDWTRRLPGLRLFGIGHDRHPADPDFGALPLPCDDVPGHDGYFRAGTAALRAMAAIGRDGGARQ